MNNTAANFFYCKLDFFLPSVFSFNVSPGKCKHIHLFGMQNGTLNTILLNKKYMQRIAAFQSNIFSIMSHLKHKAHEVRTRSEV